MTVWTEDAVTYLEQQYLTLLSVPTAELQWHLQENKQSGSFTSAYRRQSHTGSHQISLSFPLASLTPLVTGGEARLLTPPSTLYRVPFLERLNRQERAMRCCDMSCRTSWKRICFFCIIGPILHDLCIQGPISDFRELYSTDSDSSITDQQSEVKHAIHKEIYAFHPKAWSAGSDGGRKNAFIFKFVSAVLRA